MRSEGWMEAKRQAAQQLLRTRVHEGDLDFSVVLAAFDLIAFDGPTCGAAASLAKYLRAVPLEELIAAADEGAQLLSALAASPRMMLRSAPDQHLRAATSTEQAAAIFRMPAETFVASGDPWIDRPVSELGSVALALQALAWAVRDPGEQLIAY